MASFFFPILFSFHFLFFSSLYAALCCRRRCCRLGFFFFPFFIFFFLIRLFVHFLVFPFSHFPVAVAMDPPSFSGLAYRNVGTFGPFACSMQSRERGVHAVRQRRQLRLQFVLSFDGSVCMQCAFPLARCRFLWGHSCLSLSLSLRVSSHWLHFSISHFLPLSLLCISFSSCMCGHRIFVASLFDAFVALCSALNLISSAAFNAPHTHACKRHTCTRKNTPIRDAYACMYV